MNKYIRRLWNLSSTLKNSSEKQLAVTLKEEQVYSCVLTLPTMSAKEIKEAVRWELPFHIPLSAGSYYYDYRKLGKSEGMEKIQVVAVAKEVIQKLDAAAKEKGLLLVAVNVDGYDGLNLFPEGKERLKVPRSKLYKLGSGVALSLTLILFLGSWGYKIIQVQKLNAVQKKLKAFAKWEERFKIRQSNLERSRLLETAIAKFEKERVVWSRLLPILGSCIPKECWLTQVKQREENNFVELQGKAVNILQVQKLLENLQATSKFKNIKLLETSEGKNELLKFKILLQGKGERL